METEVVNALSEEKLLLQRAALGSRTAYSALYTFYLPKLFKYIYPFLRCSKEDTEEVLHDMFMKIWERKEELSNIKSFKSYLYSMARNKLVNLHEHSKVKQKAVEYLLRHSNITTGNTDDHYTYVQYNEIMQNAIRALPPKRRSVFEMSVYENLSQDEIAEKLNISKSMVKKQLYSATHYVKDYLRVHADLTAFLAVCISMKIFK
jgi:RNA polymerase sigma-70 factor (family 1)